MKLILSNTSYGAYQGVIKILKSNLSSGAQNVIIAPDRFTASIESSVISSLEVDGSFSVEVMSFTRLANKLIGKDIHKCLTPEGSVMLIGKVILDCKEDLKYYGKVALADGFASELYAALTAIRNSGITSQQLLEREEDMSPQMRAKARDIALIYDGYLKALEGKHSDSSTRLCALAEHIKNNPQSVATTNFYCVDIYEFSQPELEILSGLANSALSLNIGIASGYDNANKRIYPDRLISRLKSLADSKVDVIYNNEKLSAQKDVISKKLFAYVNTKNGERVSNDGVVSLRVAKDKQDEIIYLATDIRSYVRGGGRYKDCEVYVSDLDGYCDEIISTLSRYDIPYFIDKKEMLIEQAKARYILDAIAIIRSGFARREVLNFIKNPLFILKLDSEEHAYMFENYCLKYNIEYSRFITPFKLYDEDLNKQKPQFIYNKKDDKVLDLQLEYENVIPERVRQQMIEAINPLNIKEGENIKKFVEGAKKVLDMVDSEWQCYVDKVSAISKFYKKCQEQVDDKLVSVLDEIYEVLDYPVKMIDFESVFKAMLKTIKIAVVPTFADCVFIGDKDSRFLGNDTLYVIGANNQKLPDVSSGGVVLSQKDEQMLSALGVEITPNQRHKVMTSMYAICDLFLKPKKCLKVSYPESADGVGLRPSTVIFELQNMLEENGKPLEIERVDFEHFMGDTDKMSKLFSTKKACYFEVIKALESNRCDILERDTYASAKAFIDKDDRNRIDKIKNTPTRIEMPSTSYFGESTSVSRLETFYHCPYQHYFNYILSLKRRKDGDMEGTENGTILHFMLEQLFNGIKDDVIKDDNIEDKAIKYFDLAIMENNFSRLFEKEDTKRQLMRVKQEGINVCKDLFEISKHSSFKTAYCEAKIGSGDIKPMALPLGDKEVMLRGTIDRVDVFGDSFLIIDYKTFKSADLSKKEVYYGEKIQLFMYMRAIENSLQLKPCGVFYLPIFASFADESTSRYKYKGQASNSLEVLQAIDDRVIETPEIAIAPYKMTKGVLNKNTHISVNDMDTLGDYAVAIASKGAEEIANGYIKPSPIQGSCDRCNFSSICAYKARFERKLTTVSDMQAFCLNDEEDEDNE